MKYIYSIILLVFLISFSGIGQPTYWWELKQSGSSLGGPIDVMRYDSDVVYYGTNIPNTSTSFIYKSTDRGETFAITGTIVPGASEIKAVILDDFNPGTFLVAIESSPNDKIYKTTDDGQIWVLTLNEGQMSYFGIPMTRDPTHPDTIYTMTNSNFKRSTDFGSTWTTIASNFGPSSAPCDIEVFPDTSIILIGDNRTGIFRSLDYGLTWSQVYSTSGEIPTVSVDFTNPGVAWATKWSGGGGLLKSTDYGENWSFTPGFTGINMWGVHIQRTDGNIILTNSFSTSPGSWRSNNGGATWTPINIPSRGYQVVSVDSMTQFAAQGSGFYKLNSDLFIPVELTSFTADASENEIILNWTTATELNNQGFEIDRSFDNEFFEKIGFVPGFGTTTESKSYTYKIAGLTSGIQYYRLKQIDFDGTYQYSDVIEVEGITPGQFTLLQNYPNPFNPSTVIKYEIPGQARNDNMLVVLKVYDVLGNEITTLVNEKKPAGSYEVKFSAKGGSLPAGRHGASGGNAWNLSSGIYLYQLQSPNFTQTKKMILLK